MDFMGIDSLSPYSVVWSASQNNIFIIITLTTPDYNCKTLTVTYYPPLCIQIQHNILQNKINDSTSLPVEVWPYGQWFLITR